MEPLTVTRISNACVLFAFAGEAILTDPWFTASRLFTELPAMAAGALPRLAAIVGSHSVPDHWNIDALAGYPFRETTPVLVATASMRRRARAAGFVLAEQVEWGRSVRISETLTIEVVAAQRVTGLKVNNYVFESRGLRVFFGGEARDLRPLRTYRAAHAGVDLFVAPINGMRLLGHKLVMTAADALEGASIMGAHTLIPIHYAHRSLLPLAYPTAGLADLHSAPAVPGQPAVVSLAPGVAWRL